MQKVRRNRQLTPDDFRTLEQMLVDAGVGAPEDLARASEQDKRLGLFVRSLVGLDRDAAVEAFSRFLDDRAYNRAQIDFVWVVVTHLTEAGVMDADRLYEAPFTDHTHHGPEACSAAPTLMTWLVRSTGSARQPVPPKAWPD